MVRHKAFGLRIWSNQTIPYLPEVDDANPADLSIYVGEEPSVIGQLDPIYPPPGRPELHDTCRFVYRIRDTGMLFIRYEDDTKFYIDSENRNIWTTWVAPYTIEDMATYLLGPVLGFILRRMGLVALHASSFVVGDRAVALVGSARAGKSTTVAALALRGYSILADDVSAIEPTGDDRFLVRSSYPQVRLWPESSRMLYGSASALPPITPNWDKRDFHLSETTQFQETPVVLGAVYFLEGRVDETNAPRVESIQGAELLIKLVENTYGNVLLDDSMRAAEFATLGRLIHTVPMKRIVPHASPHQLDNLCDLVLSDAQQLLSQEFSSSGR